MKKIILLTVADSWHHFDTPIQEYSKRLQREAEVVLLKPIKSGSVSEIREKDTKNILNALEKYSDAYVVFCDVLGKNPGETKIFSEWLSEKMQTRKTVIFIIGGAYGLDPSLLANEIDFTLQFSDWTLPHGLAVLVLLEQLYRAMNILSGGKYHHE